MNHTACVMVNGRAHSISHRARGRPVRILVLLPPQLSFPYSPSVSYMVSWVKLTLSFLRGAAGQLVEPVFDVPILLSGRRTHGYLHDIQRLAGPSIVFLKVEYAPIAPPPP